MRSLLGGIAPAIIFGATVLFLLVLVGPQSANAAMCPDGSYVSGSTCTLCPNGSYVGGGRCVLQPDGTYTGGFGGYGGSPAPGPTFNSHPALQGRGFDIQEIQRKSLQNQLLQQQLQQQRWQLQQQQIPTTRAGVLKGDPLNADEAFVQATAAPIGKTIAWSNPNAGNYGTVTPVREGTKNTGEYCREYHRTIMMADGTKQGYAVFCRQGDGPWRME